MSRSHDEPRSWRRVSLGPEATATPVGSGRRTLGWVATRRAMDAATMMRECSMISRLDAIAALLADRRTADSVIPLDVTLGAYFRQERCRPGEPVVGSAGEQVRSTE